MTLPDTTVQHIRASLVTGIETHNRRRRTRRRFATAIPVVAAAIGGGLVVTSNDSSPAYALTRAPNGIIRVEVYPNFDEVEGLQAALADAGLDAVVIHLRSHPSLDGVIEVSSHNNENSGAFEFDNGEFVIDASAVEGEIEILIYSTADEGQPYQAAPSIFAPGQQLGGLACAYPDAPLTPAELERRSREVGLTDFVWVKFDELGAGSTSEGETDERPDGVVGGAQLRDADTLMVSVYADLPGVMGADLSLSGGAHYRDAPTCTPELAAPWN